MEPQDQHGFAADRPILTMAEDLLGRATFATDLAGALAGWRGKDSLVVALHGDWGSGKSSIKNMALNKLADITSDAPEIIDFSPWEWAAQDKITASFFQEISSSVGRRDRSRAGKKLAATLKKYGRYLNTGEAIVTGLSAALPRLFVLSTLVGIGGNIADESWIKNLSLALLGLLVVWAGALKWGKTLLDSLGSNIESLAKGQEQGLREIREELTILLRKRTASLIVVMDDLDRLTSEQLRMVFQLVKANVEFPNVVFLLLFHRDFVEQKLNDGPISGRDYLEKIIQVPFDIPKIDTTRLHNLLFSKLDAILQQDESAKAMFDAEYWSKIFYGSLHAYFDNLRNIYRFTSTLSFHFAHLKNNTAFGINPVDLIAIECLRLFEPAAYREIANAKAVLTKNTSDYSVIGRNITQHAIINILNKTSEGKKPLVEDLLKKLFPAIQRALEGSRGNGHGESWLRQMRICHAWNFDKYFQFSIPGDSLSNADLTEILSATADAAKFSSVISALLARGTLKNALAQFEAFTDEIPLANAATYFQGLSDVGDHVDNTSVGFMLTNSFRYLVRLAVAYLRRIDDMERRGSIVLESFAASPGIALVGEILQIDEEHRAAGDGNVIFADRMFNNIKSAFIVKLTGIAESTPQQLTAHQHLKSLLYRWQAWGEKAKLATWLNEQLHNTDTCLQLLKAFVTYSPNTSDGQISLHIELEAIENFVALPPLLDCLERADLSGLNYVDQDTLMAFQQALKRRENSIGVKRFDGDKVAAETDKADEQVMINKK